MDNKRMYTVLVLSGVIMAMAVQPAQAYDQHRKSQHYRRQGKAFGTHRHESHGPQSYGHVSFALPRGFVSIAIGREKYHYHDGVYYRQDSRGYVITPPPAGTCIRRLPLGHTKIYIDGASYYAYNGIYYEYTPRGYVVIEKPRTKFVKRGMAIEDHDYGRNDASFEINIPNKHGGYTTVILKRSGDGFAGPQGEYYEEFPRVDKLKVIYGS